jgi:alpha-tubulin suppressor-like RCC1 family protein
VLVVSVFNQNIKKIAAGQYYSLMLNNKGIIFAFGRAVGLGIFETRTIFYPVSPIIDYSTVKFIDIAAGTDHNLILSDKGKVYTFGSNGV